MGPAPGANRKAQMEKATTLTTPKPKLPHNIDRREELRGFISNQFLNAIFNFFIKRMRYPLNS